MPTAEELDDCTHVTNPVSQMIQYDPPRKSKLRDVADHGIDFDAAHKAWMANKVRKGAMTYYRCPVIQKNGNQCPHAQVCKRHRHKI